MKAVEIKKDVFWVGAVDFGCHNFHGYSIAPRGTSYNAYIIKDKKNVLFDTVQAHEAEAFLAHISQIIDLEKIDYIVSNHLELDHAGCLDKLVERCRPEKIFCSGMGLKSMAAYFDTAGWPVEAVKSGDAVNIGSRNIHFLETRMLHWPDSMFSYIPEEKLLISNDAFGQNIASSHLYSHEIDPAALNGAVEEYYYNIVLPFSQQVLKTVGEVTRLGWDIDMIAPDHGMIWRGKEEVGKIIGKYVELAEQKPRKKALIFYDTMWHSTEELAYAIGDGLKEAGVDYRIMFLKNHHHSEVMTELAKCGAVLAGSPTHNNSVMPLVSAMLTYMKGLKPQNRIGAAFGSYGWSGESPKQIQEILESMKMELPAEPLRVYYKPKASDLEAARELGRKVGGALVKKMTAQAPDDWDKNKVKA